MEQERRKASRTAFCLEVEVWGRKGPHEVADLSVSGVFIHTEKASQYVPGDEIDIVLKFPTEEEAMLLKAKVRRVTEKGIGVEFLNLTPYSAETIEACYKAFGDKTPQEDS